MTIFESTDVPAVVNDPEVVTIQLGVRFKSNVDGKILGIRFYKGSQNTGTHVGSLWTSTGPSTGTRMATVNFTNETASGWQQANFAPPGVTITANTTYVAVYQTTVGHYSSDENYFAGTRGTVGVNNGPLHAFGNGESGGPNGVYSPGGTTVFPNQTWNASNYWVDVVFQPN